MAAPFSVLFGHLQAVPAGTTVFTVPTGHVYVLRDVDIYQDQLVGAAVVRMAEAVANLFFYSNGMPVTRFAWLQWTGRQVFEAGESLQIFASLPTTVFRLSGYDLTA
jgi:hypothetical protein